MIVRVTRGQIRPGMEAAVFERLRAMVGAAPTPDGLEAFVIARRIVDGRLELVAVTTWRDLDAMRAVMDDEWMSPSFSSALEAFIETASVDHFETIAESYHGLGRLDPAEVDLLGSTPVDPAGALS